MMDVDRLNQFINQHSNGIWAYADDNKYKHGFLDSVISNFKLSYGTNVTQALSTVARGYADRFWSDDLITPEDQAKEYGFSFERDASRKYMEYIRSQRLVFDQARASLSGRGESFLGAVAGTLAGGLLDPVMLASAFGTLSLIGKAARSKSQFKLFNSRRGRAAAGALAGVAESRTALDLMEAQKDALDAPLDERAGPASYASFQILGGAAGAAAGFFSKFSPAKLSAPKGEAKDFSQVLDFVKQGNLPKQVKWTSLGMAAALAQKDSTILDAWPEGSDLLDPEDGVEPLSKLDFSSIKDEIKQPALWEYFKFLDTEEMAANPEGYAKAMNEFNGREYDLSTEKGLNRLFLDVEYLNAMINDPLSRAILTSNRMEIIWDLVQEMGARNPRAIDMFELAVDKVSKMEVRGELDFLDLDDIDESAFMALFEPVPNSGRIETDDNIFVKNKLKSVDSGLKMENHLVSIGKTSLGALDPFRLVDNWATVFSEAKEKK